MKCPDLQKVCRRFLKGPNGQQDLISLIIDVYLRFHIRKGHSIRSHETESPRLGTHMTAIHVPVELLFVVRCLTVDVPHERAA